MTKNVNIDIEYVYVEMVFDRKDKANNYEVISGLLQGIKIDKGSTFVLLHGKKGATNIVNSKFYDIMTIEVRHSDHKDMTYLTESDSDQALGLGQLNTIYNDLLKNTAFVPNKEDNDLISVSKYINVPKNYYGETPTNSSNITNNNFNQHYSSGVGNFVNNQHVKNVTTVLNKKEKIVPFIFNRTKTKKPNKQSLSQMQIKIDQINKGEFICTIPEIPEDIDTDTKNLYEDPSVFYM